MDCEYNVHRPLISVRPSIIESESPALQIPSLSASLCEEINEEEVKESDSTGKHVVNNYDNYDEPRYRSNSKGRRKQDQPRRDSLIHRVLGRAGASSITS